MAKKPAARIGEPTQHGSILDGSPNHQVFINGKLAWTVAGAAGCPRHLGKERAAQGADQVFIGGNLAVGEGEFLLGDGEPNRIMRGSPDVNLGCPDIGAAHTEAYQQKFCTAYCEMKRRWPTLTMFERQRLCHEVFAPVFAELGAPAGYFDPHIADSTKQADWNGMLWRVGLPRGTFTSQTPPSEEVFRHEIRHSEQTMGALRFAILSGQTPADLKKQGFFPDAVDAAAARPLVRESPEASWARVMHDEILTPAGQKATTAAIEKSADAYYERPLGQDAMTAHDDHAGTPGPQQSCKCLA